MSTIAAGCVASVFSRLTWRCLTRLMGATDGSGCGGGRVGLYGHRGERRRGRRHGRGRCRGRCGRGRLIVRDADPEVGRDTGEASRVALADGTELPLSRAPVELPEHERGLGVRVGDLEADQVGAGRILHGQVQARDLTERRPVDGCDDRDLVDLRGDRREVDRQRIAGPAA